MPSFYPDAYSRRLPLTPKEYDPVYAVGRNGEIQGPTPLSYASQAPMIAPYEKDTHEYLEPYGHHRASFAAPGPLSYSHQSVLPTNYDAFHLPKPAPQPQIYGSAEAPVMPPHPIQYTDRAPVDDASAQRYRGLQDARSKVEAPKTERAVAVGGVAAYLDYEMDQMSEFVSEMAQGMYDLYISKLCLADIDLIRSVQPGVSVSPAFRKFVLQILSSTRLPSSTILLGLYYLSTRMTMLSKLGQNDKSSNGEVYRMLTISLLLGSKFLDDNTFQNRSWSEVSGLAVSELNTLEVEWLVAIDWKLHIDLPSHPGYKTMSDHWTSWKKKLAARTAASQLPPIDTSIQRRYSRQQEISHPSGYAPGYPKQLPFSGTAESYSSQYPPPARFDKGNWTYHPRPTLEYSPPSAPETGPPTPDYRSYGGPWAFNPPPPYSLQHPTHGPVQLPSYAQTSYSQCFPPSIWSNHTTGCGCAHCHRAHEPYFMAPTYGPQPVVG
ncbi:MAG: hypothetical protein M1816_001502 [Peltula sp. TS41687]|nr:MAG: hypothetical protein M1816_001502 [Peltula sp. TS41687]